jgi:hypothetical protein
MLGFLGISVLRRVLGREDGAEFCKLLVGSSNLSPGTKRHKGLDHI